MPFLIPFHSDSKLKSRQTTPSRKYIPVHHFCLHSSRSNQYMLICISNASCMRFGQLQLKIFKIYQCEQFLLCNFSSWNPWIWAILAFLNLSLFVAWFLNVRNPVFEISSVPWRTQELQLGHSTIWGRQMSQLLTRLSSRTQVPLSMLHD